VQPDGVVEVSVVVRSLIGGSPLRWSKITDQPVSNPDPLR
jgi:hypothetical protein